MSVLAHVSTHMDASAIDRKARNVLWNVNLAVRKDTREHLRKLREWQYWEPERVTRHQRGRLDDLLQHAYENVPFHRRRFEEAGIVDGGRVDVARFRDLPVLDKIDVRNHFEELKSADLDDRNWYKDSSGGSTGNPVDVLKDREYADWMLAVKMLYDEWTGYRPGEPRLRIWGSDRDLFGQQSLKARLSHALRNDYYLNAFRMSHDDMRSFVERINEHEPVQILTYADSIYEFSKFIQEEGLEIHSPNSIMTSAGTLHPHMRETIQETFNAPIFDRYGSREVGDIACESEVHDGLHVCAPTHYVEILDDDGTPADPGELGEVVVTSLVNYAFPLIRYRLGDMAVKADGPRGRRGWPVLEKVMGRVTDVFVTEDGIVTPEYFVTLLSVTLDDVRWVEKFQIVQEERALVRMRIVPTADVGDPRETEPDDIAEIRERIEYVMDDDCRVEFEFVDDIAPTDSGKYRYIVSNVDRSTVG